MKVRLALLIWLAAIGLVTLGWLQLRSPMLLFLARALALTGGLVLLVCWWVIVEPERHKRV
ncbi:MAG: hypothetical protein QME94_10320 [Anaerolineae bacterium]|nr:hypothetical protein [Anaerolineae bacterium]